MEFEAKKLPQSCADRLVKLEFSWLAPYVPVLAPAYVYLKLNEKFLAVKGPLDFFSPEELERYQTYELVYFHPEIEKLERFRQAGRTLLRVFSLELKWEGGVSLPLTPYELSDQVLQCLGPLWGAELAIDPYFLVAMIQEFMGPIEAARLIALREQNVLNYERALLFSSWATFIALQYGWTNLEWLRAWRLSAFESVSGHEPRFIGEAMQLFHICGATFRPEQQYFSGTWLNQPAGTVASKLGSRLDRIRHEWNQEAPAPDSLGERGRFQSV